MKTLFAISFATIYGLSVRLLFDVFQDLTGVMSLSFLFLAPLVVGYVTVHFLSKDDVVTKRKAFFTPWLSSLAILFVTIMLQIEGAICWIMIYPLFAIVAGLGGLIYRYRHQKQIAKDDLGDENILDDWNPPSTLKASLLLLLPFVFGMIESDHSLTPKEFKVSEQVIISASPSQVWDQIIQMSETKSGEKSTPFTNLIGFPQHLYTTLDTAAVGGKRIAYYQNDLFFEETILTYEYPKRLVLDLYVDPNKVPPTVMDEHILIGGKHVDLFEDEYLLEQQTNGSTLLTLSSHFEINTPFNWYAGIWAKILMSDLLQGEIGLIKDRAESKDI